MFNDASKYWWCQNKIPQFKIFTENYLERKDFLEKFKTSFLYKINKLAFPEFRIFCPEIFTQYNFRKISHLRIFGSVGQICHLPLKIFDTEIKL